MSTIKSKKLQVGTDATSSNNFTIYQPASPDGTLRIGVGNADSPTEIAQFTSSGLNASALTGTLPALDASSLTGIPALAALSTASGSAPSYSARAWANFSGIGTPTLRSSANVTSITDHGTGDYSINFTTSMPDVNYCANVTIPAENHYCTGIGTGGGVGSPTSSYGTSAFRTGTIRSQGGAVFDPAYINIAIFR